jgi:hypothetical protein
MLADSGQVGSTQLKAGDYKAIWDGTGKDVQVKILQGKNCHGPSKTGGRFFAHEFVTVTDLNKSLQEVHFGNLQKSLVFSRPQSAATGGSGSPELEMSN